MTNYAEISDIRALGKSLTAAQTEAAEALLAEASAKLRLKARQHGQDIDALIADEISGEDYALAVKSVVVQAVCRALDSMESASAVMSQGTESIGSYSFTATYSNAGQSLYFLRNELKDLGLLRQVFGAVELYGTEEE